MSILNDLMGSFIDKEAIAKQTYAKVQEYLEDVAEELGCEFNEFFITIQPVNKEMDVKIFIYKLEGKPKVIREITLQEILKIGT